MYFEKMMEQHERKTEHVLSMQGRGLGPADQGAFAEEDFRIDTRWCGFHLAHLAEANPFEYAQMAWKYIREKTGL